MTQEPGAPDSTTPSSDSLPSLAAIEEAVQGNPNSIFRVAQAKFEEPLTPSVRVSSAYERTPEELSNLEPSFWEHESITGQPFAASYLRMDKVYASLGIEERSYLKRIDGYVGQQITEKHLRPTSQAGLGIIQSLEQELGVGPENDPFYRIEKMGKYLAALTDHQEKETLRFHLAGQRNRDQNGRFL